jgi:3-phosphoshikimate 1-carboxyvinyltransferase
MKIKVSRSSIAGKIAAPASKSYTIRGLMCAALARGESRIVSPLASDDTEAALSVWRKVGVRSTVANESWQINGGNFTAPDGDLYCGESAATLRFMSAICSTIPGHFRLTAGPSLSRRPVITLVEALRQWGASVTSHGDYAPVSIAGGTLKGGLTQLPGDISSQYISALLLAAPLASEKTRIILTTPLESVPYVRMTLECLGYFGIDVKSSADLMEFEIGPQHYHPANYQVEGDWSSASYLLALGAVAGEIAVTNLNPLSLQGDKIILDFLKDMGASVNINDNSITVKKQTTRAIKSDLSDCIDLLPTMAILAAVADGTSEFSGISRARLKESDRISAVSEGLAKAGIRVVEEEDRLIITGGVPREAVIDSKNDHRIAMAFSILGVYAGGITMDGAECVSKTYPSYWDALRSLGAKINEQ